MQRRRLISILLILILVLSGCGKEEKAVKKGKTREPAESSGQKVEPTKKVTPTPEPTPEPVELTMWCISTEYDSTRWAYESAIEEMREKYPDIKFRWEAVQIEDYRVKLKYAAAGDSLPDIFFSWPCYYIENLIEDGKVYCLDDHYEAYADLIPITMCRNSMYNGHKYGIPLSMNVVALYADMTVLNEAGFTEIPKTLEDFYKCCDSIKALGKTPFGVANGPYDTWCVTEVLEPIIQRCVGGKAYDDILRGRATWDNEDVAAAVDIFQTMQDRGYFEAHEDIGNDEVKYEFMNHSYGFYMNGTWNCADFANAYQTADWVQIGSFPVVNPEKSQGIEMIGGPSDTLCVSASSEHPDVAAEYAYELARILNRYLYLSGCGLPSWKIDYNVNEEINPLTQEAARMVAEAGYLNMFLDTAVISEDVEVYYKSVGDIQYDKIDGATFIEQMKNGVVDDPGKRGARDLQGREIVLYDYYTNPDTWDIPNDLYQENFFDMLHKAESKYNFKFTRTSDSMYGAGYTEYVALSIMENNPAGDLILLDNRWVGALLSSGYLLDVSNVSTVDWNDDKWNKAALDVMRINGGLYGFAAGTEARTGVFFNKALFQTLGVDTDLPYDLQKEGKWNWDEFLTLCARLTVDRDNDGVIDVYGVVGQDWVVAYAAMQSNGTFVITKDEKGLLKLNADDPEVVRALQFVHTLHEKGYFMPTDKNSKYWTWDWFRAAFDDGKAAMRIDEEFISNSLFDSDMDFGFVCFPYGPAAGKTVSIVREDIIVVPNCEKTRNYADDILFAYDIYTDVPPAYLTDDERWMEPYEEKNLFYLIDDRALDETIRKMVVDSPGYMYPACLIPGFDDRSYVWAGELEDGKTAQEILDAYSGEWEGQTEAFNSKFR